MIICENGKKKYLDYVNVIWNYELYLLSVILLNKSIVLYKKCFLSYIIPDTTYRQESNVFYTLNNWSVVPLRIAIESLTQYVILYLT